MHFMYMYTELTIAGPVTASEIQLNFWCLLVYPPQCSSKVKVSLSLLCQHVNLPVFCSQGHYYSIRI